MIDESVVAIYRTQINAQMDALNAPDYMRKAAQDFIEAMERFAREKSEVKA